MDDNVGFILNVRCSYDQFAKQNFYWKTLDVDLPTQQGNTFLISLVQKYTLTHFKILVEPN